MISPQQIRAARASLDLSQGEVGQATGITYKKLSRLENGITDGKSRDLTILREFFENRGLEFTEGDGVRTKRELIVYRGTDGFKKFIDDVYNVADSQGGNIRLYNAHSANWTKWVDKDWWDSHVQRMKIALEKNNFSFRITCKNGDSNFIAGEFAEYKWVPDDLFNQQSFYVYGDRLALLDFDDDMVEIVVIRRRDFATSFKQLFDIAWNYVAKPID